jgi:eukaryotic-like serine/threonine-protein kinase
MNGDDSTQPVGAESGAGRKGAAAPPVIASDLDEVRSIRRAIRLGLVIWPSFFLLDLFMCKVVYPGTDVEPFIVYRLLGEAGIALAYWMSHKSKSVRVLLAANAVMCLVASSLVSVMALSLGGFVSAYMHGISVIMLVEGAAIAAAWGRMLTATIPTALAYPAVMLLASRFDPGLRQAVESPTELAAFASHYVFVLASAVIASAVSHSVWRAKRELRRARHLHRYRLEARIGKGGMNEVWLAWDGQLERQVALKILHGNSEDVVLSRFEREARATSQLSSPHTVRIFDFGASDDGLYFIAMEYLRGMDLKQLVERHGPLEPARAVHFMLQACRSLAEAHECGIVHRDLKPANLFVARIDDDEDGLKVLDFGLARVRQPDAGPTLSKPGRVVGTPAYMAPETLDGSLADERSDIYSLGATLYHLLTGTPPFDAAHLHAVFVAHLTESPLPIAARRGSSVAPALEQVVQRCLAKQPDERFASARELADALERSLQGPAWSAEDARRWWNGVQLGSLDSGSYVRAVEPLDHTRAQ